VGTFSSTTTVPVVDGADIANLGAQTSNDKWFFQTGNESDPWDWAKGQTFTTGTSAVLLKALTYKIDPTNKKAASTTYTVRVGTLSGNNFTAIARAVCTQTVDTALGAYMTWTFSTPVALTPNTTYAIDVAMVSAVAYTTGIPYLACTGNAYVGGQYYNSGPTGGSGSGPTISASSSLDRVFHLDLDAADGTPPTLASSAIVDNKSGGLVMTNTLVTYAVTFSEDMDASTVSAADFGNAGSATVTIGTVTETTPGVFTVPVTPTGTGTLQLQVIAGAVLKDVAGNALSTASAIADDTLIAIIGDYATWAGGAAFGWDSNNDGVADGLAWLLGSTNPSAAATALLPKISNEGGKLVLTFRCLKTALRGTSLLKVQYTNDLSQTDLWTSHEALVPDADGPVGSVVFDTTPDVDPAFIEVRAEIPASAASPGGKLFGRLYSTGP
jgi:hypothetical protein